MSFDSESRCLEVRADTNISINIRTYSIGYSNVGSCNNQTDIRVMFYKNDRDREEMTSVMNKWVHRKKSHSFAPDYKHDGADYMRLGGDSDFRKLSELKNSKYIREEAIELKKRNLNEETEIQSKDNRSGLINIKTSAPTNLSFLTKESNPYNTFDQLHNDQITLRDCEFKRLNPIPRHLSVAGVDQTTPIHKQFLIRLRNENDKISFIDWQNNAFENPSLCALLKAPIDSNSKCENSLSNFQSKEDLLGIPASLTRVESFASKTRDRSKTTGQVNILDSSERISETFATGDKGNSIYSKHLNGFYSARRNSSLTFGVKWHDSSRYNLKLSNSVRQKISFERLTIFLEDLYLKEIFKPGALESFNKYELIIICKIMKVPKADIPTLLTDMLQLRDSFEQFYTSENPRNRKHKITNNKRFIFRKMKATMIDRLFQDDNEFQNKKSKENEFFSRYFKSQPEYLTLNQAEADSLQSILKSYEEHKIKVLWRFKKFTRDFSSLFFNLTHMADNSHNLMKLNSFKLYLQSLCDLDEAAIINSILPIKSLPLSSHVIKQFMVDFFNSFGGYLQSKP